MRHTSRVKHDGRLHTVELPDCAFRMSPSAASLSSTTTLTNRLPRHCGSNWGCFGRSDSEEPRGVGTESTKSCRPSGGGGRDVSRWENGALTQTRAMDRYLRVYFGVPAARLRSWNRLRFPSWEFASQRNDPLPDTHVSALASGPARPVTGVCHPYPEGDVTAHARPSSPSRHRHHPPQV